MVAVLDFRVFVCLCVCVFVMRLRDAVEEFSYVRYTFFLATASLMDAKRETKTTMLVMEICILAGWNLCVCLELSCAVLWEKMGNI